MLLPSRTRNRHGAREVDGLPDSIEHFSLERAHRAGASTVSSLIGLHRTSGSGQPDDRWMPTYLRYPAGFPPSDRSHSRRKGLHRSR